MRNFRKAALAGATAAAVAFGSTAVATAQETTAEETTAAEVTTVKHTRTVDPTVDGKDGVEPGSSNKIANSEWLEFRKDDQLQGTDGEALFGSSKEGFDEQPRYARLAYGATVFTTVSAIIGLIVGPLYNFIVHGDFQF